MKYAVLMVACALPLAACNKPAVNEKNASVSDVANAVSKSGIAGENFIRAGQWQVKGKLEDMSMPGLPPEAQTEMKRVMGQVQNNSFEYCVTPEEAKHPGGKMFTGKDNGDCRYDHFQMGGGKFDAALRCQSKGQGPSQLMTMTMNGTYSPDAYTSNVSMKVEGGPQGTMTMKMRSEAKRIGECTAETAKTDVTKPAG
jgi:hypothetical protein